MLFTTLSLNRTPKNLRKIVSERFVFSMYYVTCIDVPVQMYIKYYDKTCFKRIYSTQTRVKPSHMQSAINEELHSKIALAVKHGIVPKNTSEIEFTVDLGTGQGTVIEYWPSCARIDCNRVEVMIAPEYLEQFVFAVSAKFYKTNYS